MFIHLFTFARGANARTRSKAVLFSLILAFTFLLSPVYTSPAQGQTSEQVRNVIYIIGDGTSFEQLQIGRLMNEGSLVVDDMEVQSKASNPSLNNSVTDSAAAGTAHATGVRTNNRMVSMLPDGTPIPTIVEMAKKAGLATGVVTNDAIHGATPAVYVAHARDRSESESITEQAVFHTRPDVLMGGGLKAFTAVDGPRRIQNTDYDVVFTREQLLAWEPSSSRKLLGLFASGSMAYSIDRPASQPTLADMARVALKTLADRSERGFFLMLEDDRLDAAGHNNDLRRLAYQTRAFNEMIAVALEFASRHPDTLVVVTADHETGGLTRGPGTVTYESLTQSFEHPVRDELAQRLGQALAENPSVDLAQLIEQLTGIHDLDPSLFKSSFKNIVDTVAGYNTYYYTTTRHTRVPVPVFAHGPGARRFERLHHISDMGQTIIELLGLTD